MQEALLPSHDARVVTRTFAPQGAPLGSVVIAAAMGIGQSYYQPFAEWLASQGWRVTTFDYRGMGASLQGPMRGAQATLADWARDYEAVITHAKAALPAQPLYVIGHSLGGQLPGFFAAPQQVDGMVTVASGSGYWRDNPKRAQRGALLLWWVILPIVTRLAGYFPGKRLGMVGDMPRGVALQWRRWCLHPRYGAGAEDAAARYAQVRFPIHALMPTDDELMTRQGIEHLLAEFVNAPQQIEPLAPADAGGQRIGHTGFFRSAFRDTLWPRTAAIMAQWHTPTP